MDVSNCRSNIIGCLRDYQDVKAAHAWLVKSKHGLALADFAGLIGSIYAWLLKELLDNQSLADDVLNLMAEFDVVGDKDRREDYKKFKEQAEADDIARKRQAKLKKERAKAAKRECIRQAKLEKERAEAAECERIRLEEEVAKIDEKLRHDFLGAEAFFQTLPDRIVSKDEFDLRKISFVKKWLIDRAAKLGIENNVTMDSQQLAAVAAVNGNIKVVARAGSGKTTTLVHRALFLMEHCNVHASSLLLLAFNKKAALEMRRRLLGLMHSDADVQIRIESEKNSSANKRQRIDKLYMEEATIDKVAARLGIELPHVMTFHALAYAIVRRKDDVLYDDHRDDGEKYLSSYIQDIVKKTCDKNKESEEKVRKLMLKHFKDNWGHIFGIRFRRSSQHIGLDGKYLKSHGEKLIANFLFEHDIDYKYERVHWWDGTPYRPDFTIKNKENGNGGVIIEYFGLAGSTPDYDKMSQRKREYWKKRPDWELLEFVAEEIVRNGEAGFDELLKSRLEQLGITCGNPDEDKIWARIKDKMISDFAEAMAGFVGRCRKLSLSPDGLKGLISKHDPLSKVEQDFIKIAHGVYEHYLKKLQESNEEDFDGLMQRAATNVENGATRFRRKSGSGDLKNLRFIFIDEFQDFSNLFDRFLKAIRKVNRSVELFCVGDDWQAINGFAGSDLKYFNDFGNLIGSRQLFITTNYRSSKSIVEVGNALMVGLGKPATASKTASGKVMVADASKFKPSEKEPHRDWGGAITKMVSRIVNKSLEEGADVVMLSRINATLEGYRKPSFINLFPKEKHRHISVSTAHNYKGLEKHTVIVLDAVDRSYPLIHPNWIFARVLGENIEKIIDEERRLLYVALTRAIGKLVIITDHENQSPFLKELRSIKPLPAIDWRDYPPVPSMSVRVVNQSRVSKNEGTRAVKELLKGCGYAWNGAKQYWIKVFPANGFHVDQLHKQLHAESWFKVANGIRVQIYDGSDNIVDQFNVDKSRQKPA